MVLVTLFHIDLQQSAAEAAGGREQAPKVLQQSAARSCPEAERAGTEGAAASTSGAAALCGPQAPQVLPHCAAGVEERLTRCRIVRPRESIASQQLCFRFARALISQHVHEYKYEHECVCDVSAALEVYPFKLPLAW